MSGTAVPAGTCVTHGWHGMTTCPRCSSFAGPFTPLGAAPVVTARSVSDLAADVRGDLEWIYSVYPERSRTLPALDELVSRLEAAEAQVAALREAAAIADRLDIGEVPTLRAQVAALTQERDALLLDIQEAEDATSGFTAMVADARDAEARAEAAEAALAERDENWEQLAADKGIPFLLDHLGLDGLGNEVNDLKAALAEAKERIAELEAR